MAETAKDQHEPSMEEILASIRRIISEDSEGGEAPPAAPDAAPAAALPRPAAPPPRPAAAAPLGAATATPQAAAPKRTLIADVVEEDDDVLLLTEEAEDEAVEDSTVRLSPIDDAPPPPAPEEPKLPEIEPQLLPADAGEPLADSLPATEDDRLLSEQAAAATLAAMNELVTRSQSVPNIESLTMGQANQTLEDITRDLLRPILKSWLDDNLPHIVERIVREEIGRLAVNAQRR